MATRSTDAPSGLQLKSLTCILSIISYLRVKSLAEKKKHTHTHTHTQLNVLLRVGTQILSNLKQPRSPFSLPHLKGKWS